MGIIRQEDSESDAQENSELIEDYTPVSVNDSAAIPTNEERNVTKRAKKFRPRLHQRDVRSPKKGSGVRNTRRCENLNYLLSMVEDEEDGVSDLEIITLIEPTMTVFGELFMEKSKMQIWNDFINRTEEDQKKIIDKEVTLKVDVETRPQKQDNKLVEERERQDSTGSWDMLDDSRTVHPAFSADTCFRRVSQKLRSVLRKKHLPIGVLKQLEDEVVSFFSEWPTSVYVAQLTNSFDRLLLHSLCQYHDLSSRSIGEKSKSRQTHVENKYEEFRPPEQLLTHYLEQRLTDH